MINYIVYIIILIIVRIASEIAQFSELRSDPIRSKNKKNGRSDPICRSDPLDRLTPTQSLYSKRVL